MTPPPAPPEWADLWAHLDRTVPKPADLTDSPKGARR